MMEKYVLFSVNDELYAIDILAVTSVEESMKFVRVPGAPDFLNGIVHIRNEVLPVVDLGYVFGFEKREAISKLLVIMVDGKNLSFNVDDVLGIYTAEEEGLGIPGIARTPANCYANRVLRKDDRLIIEISPEKILSSAEKNEIDAIIAQCSEPVE